MAPKSSQELQKLQRLLATTRDAYAASALSRTLLTALQTRVWPSATKLVSLGLGSLTSTHQFRRMKQLAIFLALADAHGNASGSALPLYAQDPTFTKLDVTFLTSIGIRVIWTDNESAIGEATSIIDDDTLVYTPFLTLQAYRALFDSCSINYLIGDDFNALKNKWPKQSQERSDVDSLVKHKLSLYRRRAIEADDFWSEKEKPFPMAAYISINASPKGEETHAGG